MILEREKADKKDEADVDEFMSRLRKYAGATELTREMCLDLIGYVTVDENTGRTKPEKYTFTTSSLIRSLLTSITPLRE